MTDYSDPNRQRQGRGDPHYRVHGDRDQHVDIVVRYVPAIRRYSIRAVSDDGVVDRQVATHTRSSDANDIARNVHARGGYRRLETIGEGHRLAVHFLQDDGNWKTTRRGEPCANCGQPDRLHPSEVLWSPDHGQHRCPICRGLPRYPDISVDLVGKDGNAHNILGLVRRALREAGVAQVEIDEYFKAAKAGGYDHLLRVTMAWVDVR